MRALFALAVLMLAIRPSPAQEVDHRDGMLKRQTVKRVVASGINNQLAFFVALNPDCTSRGEMVVRVINKPVHGGAETFFQFQITGLANGDITSLLRTKGGSY
jgi:hypothetical protein